MESLENSDNVVFVCKTNNCLKHSLPRKYVKISNFLETLIDSNLWVKSKNDQGEFLLDLDEKYFKNVLNYIGTGKVLEPIPYSILDFLMLKMIPNSDVKEDFMCIQLEENWCRMFTQDNPKCPTVNLKDILDKIPQFAPIYKKNMTIFSTVKSLLIDEKLKTIIKTNSITFKLSKIIDLSKYNGKLVLAGGALISTIFSQPIKDFDLFFVDCNQDEAEKIMYSVINTLFDEYTFQSITLSACKTSWTLKLGKKCGIFQFIFRLYKNIEEVLLGFDIDSCAIAYDGKNILLSKRCEHALITHTNIVDFTRMSPTYEYRLYKYTLKGFDVYIPNLDISRLITHPDHVALKTNCEVRIDLDTGKMHLFNQTKKYRSKRRMNYRNNIGRSLLRSKTDITHSNISPQDGEKFYVSRQLKFESDLTLYGFSILMYLSSSKFHPKVSDYTLFFSAKNGEVVTNFSDHSKNILNGKFVANKFVKAQFMIYKELKNSPEYLYQLVKSKNVDIEWKIQNPGTQITSSFHAKAAQDPQEWFGNQYYLSKEDKQVDKAFITYIDI